MSLFVYKYWLHLALQCEEYCIVKSWYRKTDFGVLFLKWKSTSYWIHKRRQFKVFEHRFSSMLLLEMNFCKKKQFTYMLNIFFIRIKQSKLAHPGNVSTKLRWLDPYLWIFLHHTLRHEIIRWKCQTHNLFWFHWNLNN